MLATKTDRYTTLAPDYQSPRGPIATVAFHPDGKHVYGGNIYGVRRWRIADSRVMEMQARMSLYSISASRDHKWVVFGTVRGARVWNAELQEQVIKVLDRACVVAVDVSPDSTRFVTGTGIGIESETEASIWSITTGERLVGPLTHAGNVGGVTFSPDGRRIVTSCFKDSSIRIFDSNNGHQLMSTYNSMKYSPAPIVWSLYGQRLFAISTDNKIKSFDSSTGSQLAEWQIHGSDDARTSIAVSPNNRLIASHAGRSVSFWDTSTHTQLGILEVTHQISCIALSSDGDHLATGYCDSDMVDVWDLNGR
ncbi:hypothetical protein V8E55_002765 [Tylopilus felleus]